MVAAHHISDTVFLTHHRTDIAPFLLSTTRNTALHSGASMSGADMYKRYVEAAQRGGRSAQMWTPDDVIEDVLEFAYPEHIPSPTSEDTSGIRSKASPERPQRPQPPPKGHGIISAADMYREYAQHAQHAGRSAAPTHSDEWEGVWEPGHRSPFNPVLHKTRPTIRTYEDVPRSYPPERTHEAPVHSTRSYAQVPCQVPWVPRRPAAPIVYGPYPEAFERYRRVLPVTAPYEYSDSRCAPSWTQMRHSRWQ